MRPFLFKSVWPMETNIYFFWPRLWTVQSVWLNVSLGSARSDPGSGLDLFILDQGLAWVCLIWPRVYIYSLSPRVWLRSIHFDTLGLFSQAPADQTLFALAHNRLCVFSFWTTCLRPIFFPAHTFIWRRTSSWDENPLWENQ